MTEQEAIKIQKEIQSICQKYELWNVVEYEKKPNLKIIRIKEISIKISK